MPRPPARQIRADRGRERALLTLALKANRFKELTLSHDAKPRKVGLNAAKLRNQTWLQHLFKNDLSARDIKILRPAAVLVMEDLKNNNYCWLGLVVFFFFPFSFCLVFRIAFFLFSMQPNCVITR